MNNNRLFIAIGIGILALMVVSGSFYVVNQTQQAILLQFREVVKVTDRPGLHFKLPIIHSVEYFEKRVLAVDAPSQEVMMAEQKPLEVDAFARYRITDPLKFYQRLTSDARARDRLGSQLNATMRSVLGTVKMATLLSSERSSIMEKIRDMMNAEAKDFGVEIIDVRIRRADLPQKTSDAVFARMQSQRGQEAAQIRANGQQEAVQITADADRQATIIVAEAQSQAEKIRGEGDRKALNILAEATSKDPGFFSFWRTLTAYRNALPAENSTYVLSPDSSFFKLFNNGAASR
jgi:membrane protease subunit HflC